MSQFVIIVDFRLKPGARPEFRRLIDANAQASVATEAGCRRFDVLEPVGDADRVVLYEIYDDRSALESHVRTRHFEEFDRASRPLVEGKSVREYALVCAGG
jgi:quinol monooxygenase YgiN